MYAEKRVEQVRAVVVEAEEPFVAGELLQSLHQSEVSGVGEGAGPGIGDRRGAVGVRDGARGAAEVDSVEEIRAG